MIDELEIKKYDKMFGTRSKIFYNTIIIDSGNDEWLIEVMNKRTKKVRLLHKNRISSTNKFHQQGLRSNLYQAYDSIYRHKNILICMNNKIKCRDGR